MLSLTSVLCKSATDLTRLAVAARWPKSHSRNAMPPGKASRIGKKRNVRKCTKQLQFSKLILLPEMLSLTSVLCKSATDQTRHGRGRQVALVALTQRHASGESI